MTKAISLENLQEFKTKCDQTYAPIGGTEVVANNGEPTTETLQTLKVDDKNYKISQGTTVTANPTLSGSEAELTGLEVAGTKYKVPSGGIVAVDSLPTASQTEYDKHLLYLYNSELYYLLSATQYKLITATNYVTDELLGTWVFNDTINLLDMFGFNVAFTSIASKYTYMGGNREYLNYGEGGSNIVYNFFTGWQNSSYKTITITDTSDLTNREEFTTWLKANAVKQ